MEVKSKLQKSFNLRTSTCAGCCSTGKPRPDRAEVQGGNGSASIFEQQLFLHLHPLYQMGVLHQLRSRNASSAMGSAYWTMRSPSTLLATNSNTTDSLSPSTTRGILPLLHACHFSAKREKQINFYHAERITRSSWSLLFKDGIRIS